MIRKPKLRSSFRIEHIDDEGLLVITETDYRVLRGRVEQIAPHLRGEYTTDELIARFQDRMPAAEIRLTLDELARRGYLTDAVDNLSATDAAYWDGLGVETHLAGARLGGAVVSVRLLDGLPPIQLEKALTRMGIRVEHAGPKTNGTGATESTATTPPPTASHLLVVATPDYLHDALAGINRNAIESRTPYLLVKPVGTIIWMGPLIVPGESACWNCLAHRLRHNRPARFYLDRMNGAGPASSLPIAAVASTLETAAQIAATETAKWIVRDKTSALQDCLVTFDTGTLETRRHHIVRRPQCPECGDPSMGNQHPPPLQLHRRVKLFTADGGHRVVPPTQTWKNFSHHISPVTGIVRSIKPLSNDASGLVHSYSVGLNMASRFEGVDMIRKNLRDIGGGKGRTDQQARTSGLCEALERYSGIFHDEKFTRTARIDKIENAIHPERLLHFSARQYRERTIINEAATIPSQLVPQPFDPSQEIEWTPVWSITRERFEHVPTAYCYFGYPPEKSRFCRADSNGNAAGNTIEEAILQGFLELVERDAVAIWWYNRLPMPAVDLGTFDEPYFHQLAEYYASTGRGLWVLDVTTDLQIPSFVAVSRRVDATREDIILGFGAHYDVRLGIMRALTEMNQVLPTALNVSENTAGRPIHPDKLAVEWWSTATVANQPYLLPRSGPMRLSTDYPARTNSDLLDDVEASVAIVESRGLEMMVLDQTRPDVGLPVVKVIVPGLRHYWPRLGSGRLYDVPVSNGLLARPLAEEELNPFPLFF